MNQLLRGISPTQLELIRGHAVLVPYHVPAPSPIFSIMAHPCPAHVRLTKIDTLALPECLHQNVDPALASCFPEQFILRDPIKRFSNFRYASCQPSEIVPEMFSASMSLLAHT